MIVKQLIEVFDTLDSADASGLKVKEYLESKGATNVEVVKREKDGKSTDFVKVVIPGSNGRLKGGNAPSLVTFTSAPMYAPMRPPRLTFPCPSWVLPSIWQ